jgi:hypothetical protein
LLRKKNSGEFYQGSQGRVIGTKGIANPIDGRPIRTFEGNDIKTHGEVRKSVVARSKHRSGANDLALLVMIDRDHRFHEFRRASVANFDESKASLIEHNQVDFTAAAAEVACDGTQALLEKKFVGELLGVVA